MTQERKYKWFIEPLNDLTNNAVAEFLQTDNIHYEVLCGDGKKRNLWGCSVSNVLHLWRSRSDEIVFNVFCQEGNGKIRNVNRVVRNWIIRNSKKQEALKVPA